MTSRPTSRSESFTLRTSPEIIAWIENIANAMKISRNELLNRIIRDQMKAPTDAK
jgi:predicted HicB family RNase H-like nuclease